MNSPSGLDSNSAVDSLNMMVWKSMRVAYFSVNAFGSFSPMVPDTGVLGGGAARKVARDKNASFLTACVRAWGSTDHCSVRPTKSGRGFMYEVSVGQPRTV